jgi:hypothetical protein
MEKEALAKGRQFRDVFATLKRKAVPWGTLSATCHVAYKAGERNPWCQCAAVVRAPVEDVMAAIWAIDSEPMRYSKDARYVVHGPRLPAARSVHCDFHFRPPLGMGEITSYVKGVWHQPTLGATPLGKQARSFEIVLLPRSEGLTQADMNHRASIHSFILLEHIGEGRTRVEYTYQVDLASNFCDHPQVGAECGPFHGASPSCYCQVIDVALPAAPAAGSPR